MFVNTFDILTLLSLSNLEMAYVMIRTLILFRYTYVVHIYVREPIRWLSQAIRVKTKVFRKH